MSGSVPETKTELHYILGLDLIRFLAALCVMFYHLGFLVWVSPASIAGRMMNGPVLIGYPIWWPVTWFGWVGVDIFFVLSGFVIAYSAENASAFHFAVRRITRLAPAMWVCATVTTFVLIAEGIQTPSSAFLLYLKSITFFPIGPWSDGTYWTLGVEINFYLIIFGLLCFNKLKWLHELACVLAASSLAFWLGHIFLDHRQFFAATGDMQRTTQLLLLQDGAYFALGIEIWLCSRKRPSMKNYFVIAACMLGGILRIIAKRGIEIKAHGLEQGPYLPVFIPVLVWLFALAAIAMCVVWNKKIARFLSPYAKPIRLIGLATYPLYLVHYAVGGTIIALTQNAGLPRSLSIISGAGTILFLSLIITEIIEPRISRFLNRILIQFGEKIHRAKPATAPIFRGTIKVETSP